MSYDLFETRTAESEAARQCSGVLSFNRSKFILALLLMAAGAVSIFILTRTELDLAGKNFTSIAILLGGLVFYAGVLVIVGMFKNETDPSIALLLPSIVAVAIFVYGFIAWSVRVSFSQWTGPFARLYMGGFGAIH